MDPDQFNHVFNVVTILISGGALAAVLRYKKDIRGLQNVKEADIRDHYAQEVEALRGNVVALRGELKVARDELADCEAECRTKLKGLEEELWAEKRQRVAEQISLINLILNNVDAPELQTLRDMLERTQRHMLRAEPKT